MNLTEKQKEQLDLYADIVGITREVLLQAIIESSLKDLDVMDRIDFLVSGVNINDQFEMYKTISRQQKG